MDRLRSVVRTLSRRRWFSRIARTVGPPVDRAVHGLTGGRHRVADMLLPTLMLTTTGHRSGQRRRTPLGYVRLDAGYAVVATNWGRARDPAWAQNLRADPHARVNVAGEDVPVVARELGGDEARDVWQRFVAMWSPYAAYEDRVGGVRDIPVFALERHGQPATDVRPHHTA